MSPIESLHNHTTLSDGKMSHREHFELAQSLGISVFAFTDHDAVPSAEMIAEIEAFPTQTTKWVLGIEVTCDLPKELSPSSTAVHVIGLFVDPKNENLLLHCRRAQEARIKRMEKIVVNLQDIGFRITAEDCLEMSEGESVGRPHIVQAINKYPENALVMEKIRLEMADEASRNPVIQEQYSQMMKRGETQYPYTLFLTATSFKSGYIDPEYLPDLDEAVKIIRDAGGIAGVAHYHTVSSKMPLEFFEKLIIEKRIDGAEIIYGQRAYGTLREKEIEVQRQALREIIAKHGAVAFGGSDAHTREDLEQYAANDWFSNESIGLTSRILENRNISKKFSAL